MKIGVLLSRFPYPLEKGDKLRAYHQIKELSKRHQIYLCAISDKTVTPESIKELEPFCEEIKIVRLRKVTILWNLVIGLFFSKLPLQIAYFFKKSDKTNIQQFFINHEVDHIFCQLIRVTEYIKDLKKIPRTLDYMDALSRGMERRIEKAPFYLKSFVELETKRLKRYEHFIFPTFNNRIIISEQDRDLIIHPNNHEIQIVRNGVDQTFFKPIHSQTKYDLVFTGNMSYPPNVDGVSFLVENILPPLWKEYPELTLAIVGANPSSKVQKLAQKNVIVTGWVDDIRSYYAASKIFIAPMQIGTGLQNKLLEAMAMQIPCITSPLANNALKATNGQNILIAQSIDEYIFAIKTLLTNKDKAKQIAASGLAFINQQYNWSGSTNIIEGIIKNGNTRVKE